MIEGASKTQAQVVFGVIQDPRWNKRVRVTLLQPGFLRARTAREWRRTERSRSSTAPWIRMGRGSLSTLYALMRRTDIRPRRFRICERWLERDLSSQSESKRLRSLLRNSSRSLMTSSGVGTSSGRALESERRQMPPQAAGRTRRSLRCSRWLRLPSAQTGRLPVAVPPSPIEYRAVAELCPAACSSASGLAWMASSAGRVPTN